MQPTFRAFFICTVAVLMAVFGCKEQKKTNTNAANLADSLVPPGAGLHVQAAGGGDTTLLLIHAFGGDVGQWKPQIQYWRDRFRVVAFDLPAHGESPKALNGDYSINAMEWYVEKLVDSIRPQKLILIGHSMGAATALAYAARHPEKVTALVLEGASGQMPAQQKLQTMAMLRSPSYDTVMQQYMDQLLTNATITTNRSERDGMKKLDKEDILKMIESNFDFDNVAALNKYHGPVLIVSADGEDDRPGTLGSFFPKLMKRHIDKTSHWAHLDKPAVFNAAVDSFINMTKSLAPEIR